MSGRRDTQAHRVVALIGWVLATVGVIGLVVSPSLLVVWVVMIAFGVAAIPRAIVERWRDRPRQ